MADEVVARYICPNDGEILMIDIDPSTSPPKESYICQLCKYRSTKTNAQGSLKVATINYVPPSKKKGK